MLLGTPGGRGQRRSMNGATNCLGKTVWGDSRAEAGTRRVRARRDYIDGVLERNVILAVIVDFRRVALLASRASHCAV